MKNTRLSKHFLLGEFLRLDKYPDNIPTIYQFAAPGNHLEHPDMMFGLGTTNNTKIIAELFGHFRYFLYLCRVIRELITKGGKQSPDVDGCNEFLIP